MSLHRLAIYFLSDLSFLSISEMREMSFCKSPGITGNSPLDEFLELPLTDSIGLIAPSWKLLLIILDNKIQRAS